MINTTYVIRKIAFHYSDDHYYPVFQGAIKGIFNNREEAEKALFNMEKEAMLKVDLSRYEPFFLGDIEDVGKIYKFKAFCEREFNLEIVSFKRGLPSIKRDTYLPKEITTEQINAIRVLIGFKFYELVTFIEKPQFYGIWYKKPFCEKEGFRMTYDRIYFYNSYMEAFKTAIERSPWISQDIELKGKLSSLSEMPNVLKSVIDASKNITYDTMNEILMISRLFRGNDWISIYGLLKDKPFEIRTLSLIDVENIDHESYEIM